MHIPGPFYKGLREFERNLEIYWWFIQNWAVLLKEQVVLPKLICTIIIAYSSILYKGTSKTKNWVAPCAIAVKADFRIPYISCEVDTILIMQMLGY